MAVRGGLTRFARPAGSPLTAFTVCPTGCRQLSTPGRGFSSPRCVQYTKKKPVLSYELFFKYGGEGGIDSLRSPCGQPAHCVHGLSNWLSPVVEPRSGLLIPRCVQYTKKKPVLSYELFFKYGGEGGIDSLRSPCGQPAHCVHGLSNWLSPVVEPRSGLLIPPVCAIYEKKARTFVRALL